MGRGDTEALSVLLERHWASLARYATDLLGSRDDAEDVAVETFERLWERRGAWLVDGSVLPLLLRIARNMCLDMLRRRSARVRATDYLPKPPSPLTPIDATERAEIRELVTYAVDCLPRRRREVLLLTRMHGLSRREVAEVMDLAPQTVANHLQLAMDDVRRVLAPYLHDPLEGPTAERVDADGEHKRRSDVRIQMA
jgi:RNA polymerase sigma-70 factor (ECF subfamily)